MTYRASPSAINMTNAVAGATLELLVENMGRINYGHDMTDRKVGLGNDGAVRII